MAPSGGESSFERRSESTCKEDKFLIHTRVCALPDYEERIMITFLDTPKWRLPESKLYVINGRVLEDHGTFEEYVLRGQTSGGVQRRRRMST